MPYPIGYAHFIIECNHVWDTILIKKGISLEVNKTL